MAEWKQNDWGLWVPEGSWERTPHTTSINDFRSLFKKLKSEKKYLLAKRRRQVVRGTERAPDTLGAWEPLDVEKLKAHVLGRAEESVKVLVGVAFLRSLERVPRDPEVNYRGALYQFGQGSKLYAAAHRFPCDPTINNWSIPHYSRSKALADELEEPLKKTDYLPKLVNYADLLFEYGGGKEAVLEPIRFVLHDQKPGVPRASPWSGTLSSICCCRLSSAPIMRPWRWPRRMKLESTCSALRRLPRLIKLRSPL